MTKDEQGKAKDVGGFVGGTLTGNRRSKSTIESRSLVTLDADTPAPDFIERVAEVLAGTAYVIYSTHSHTPERPRYRLIVPLVAPVGVDEYEPTARKMAEAVGLENFDPSTFEPERMMYWPSASTDGEYIYKEGKGAPAVALDWLLMYDDWTDVRTWPGKEKEKQAHARPGAKKKDPRTIDGPVGDWCRTYSIYDVLADFLGNVYEPSDGDPNRYTYTPGETKNGAVVYEGLFFYSFHGTDPARGQLLNAFDLVRLHYFGHLDEHAQTGTPLGKLPSMLAMLDMVAKDGAVQQLKHEQKKKDAADLLAPIEEEGKAEGSTDWIEDLERNPKTGAVKGTAKNVITILRKDPALRGAVGFDTFASRVAVLKNLPWRKKAPGDDMWGDRDDACLRNYISNVYGVTGKHVIDDCFIEVVHANEFHPILDELEGYTWDGVERIETLFIKCLGAEDTPFIRAVTRCWCIAAIARLYRPGCNFDNIIVLVGPQGIGKTQILSRLGGKYFNNSITDIKNKDAVLQLVNSWIVELGELAPTRKAESEDVKAFISRERDIFRAPYGRHVMEYPRHNVMSGTTNEVTFLKDQTGNRRFWPIVCNKERREVLAWEYITDEIRGQIWAEAIHYYKSGESWQLSQELQKVAEELQEGHTEGSDILGAIEAYVFTPVPVDKWPKMNIYERREYFDNYVDGVERGAGYDYREYISAIEVYCECLKGSKKEYKPRDARYINGLLEKIKGLEIYRLPNGTPGLIRPGAGYGRQRCYTVNPLENEWG